MRIPKKTALIIGLLIVVGAVGLWLATNPAATKLAAPTAVPVRVVSVAQKDVPRFVSGIGSVLSLHSVVIRPQIDGILTKLLVKEGQLVNKGDLLATIDDRSIRASLDQAKAQLGESQAQLQVAQVNLKRYKLLSVDDGVSKQTYTSNKPWSTSSKRPCKATRQRSTRRRCSCPTRKFVRRSPVGSGFARWTKAISCA